VDLALAPWADASVACAVARAVEERRSHMSSAPLEAAMARYAAGNEAALGEVYDLASGPIFGFLVRMTHDRATAEDLTHETFLRIHRARGVYREGAPVLPWAYSIARRLFLDWVRSRRREVASLDEPKDGERKSDPGIPATDAAADDLVAASRLAEQIEAVLAKIPETQATAFRLLKQEGLSIAEAAAIVGATETSVKLRAHRAYEALRAALGEEWLGEGAAKRST
jgi:RNA polymerase sigma-70 factor (ECF subfamily)